MNYLRLSFTSRSWKRRNLVLVELWNRPFCEAAGRSGPEKTLTCWRY